LVGLLAAAAVAVFAVMGARRQHARQAWLAQRDGALAESRWLARQLLPAALAAETATARRNIWLASRPRVETLESHLSDVVMSAPVEEQAALGRLRDALTGVQSALDADAAPGAPDDRESLGAARQAQRQLEEALRAFPLPPEGWAGPTQPPAQGWAGPTQTPGGSTQPPAQGWAGPTQPPAGPAQQPPEGRAGPTQPPVDPTRPIDDDTS
jgi:hypothetical protein